MYCKIKSSKLSFKITDLLGLLSLIYPICLLVLGYSPDYFFYAGILLAMFFLSFNFFGLRGYFVKIDNTKVVVYDNFVPVFIKIKNIVDIEKETEKIIFKTNDEKIYVIDFDKILKSDKHKLNDFYYDIHNKTQRKTLKV